VTALEDKIVQRAAGEVMNAIYEQDFADLSYGFRPGRSQHHALDQLYLGIEEKKVSWVLDVDIRAFFDSLSQEWLVKFMEHRIGDRRMVRLIQKWLRAGVLEEGKLMMSEEGTLQGGSISPLLANVYLHYVLDLWVQVWQRKIAQGEMVVVRFADDIVIGFQKKAEAERFLGELKERMKKFNLELHPEKTRLVEFGRFAALNRQERGEGKPETFNFLGFTHICGKTRRGRFTVIRQTIRKRMQAKLKAIQIELQRRLHDPPQDVGQWLKAVVGGHIRYYGVPTNSTALRNFRYQVSCLWRRMLGRRSQFGYVTWKRVQRLIDRWLPPARISHPYPSRRRPVTT
jgi:group II intron reverse transcriptase/maturase